MKTIYPLLVTILALAACATSEQRAERAIARHGPFCERLGHTPDTQTWRDCIQRAHSDWLRAIYSH